MPDVWKGADLPSFMYLGSDTHVVASWFNNDPFWVNVCKGCEFCVQVYVSVCRWSAVPASIVEKTIFCPLSWLRCFLWDHWVYLGGSMSWFSILFHWFVCLFFHKYCTVLVTVVLLLSLEVGESRSFIFVLLQYYICDSGLWCLHRKYLQSICQYPKVTCCDFDWNWIYRSSCKEYLDSIASLYP